MRPCKPAHDLSPDTCHLCRLAVTDPAYAAPYGEQAASYASCRHQGETTGETVQCGTCTRGVRLKLFACAKHGSCTRGKQAPGVACCDHCPDRDPPVRQFVVSADGIGDHLQGLAVFLAAARQQNDPCFFVAKPWVAPWVRLFLPASAVLESELPRVPAIEDMSRRGGLHFVEACRSRCQTIPFPRPISSEVAGWSAGYEDCVVLAPWAGYTRPGAPSWSPCNRVWLRSHWLAVETALRKKGYRVVAVDTDASRSSCFHEPLIGLNPQRMAALLSVSLGLISNESGMAHLAGALGVPTLVLSSLLDGPYIHKLWPRTRVIEGPLSCTRCRWQGPHYRQACETLCASLQAIQPEDVVGAFDDLYLPAPGRLHDPVLDRAIDLMIHQVDVPLYDGRRRLFCRVFDQLTRHPDPAPLVVETGTMRQDDDWGAGMFTLVMGRYLAASGGKLISIDNDPAHVAFARSRTQGLPVEVIHDTGAAHLATLEEGSACVLYLDSADVWTEGFTEVCLEEAQTGASRVRPGGLLVIDDTFTQNGSWSGKGSLAVPWLLEHGFKLVGSSHQTILEKRP